MKYIYVFTLNSVDLEWKIIYVGSASNESYDQVLDSVLVGPVPQGRHRFVFQVQTHHKGVIYSPVCTFFRLIVQTHQRFLQKMLLV